MKATIKRVGRTAGHAEQPATPVDAFSLDSGAGVEITVWTYGATLARVLAPDRSGDRANIVLGFDSVEAYEREENRFLGSTLGRYARCVANGELSIDGEQYRLHPSEGPHHIHGGPFGFDRFVWEADLEEGADQLALHLRLERPDGDQGYPGAVAAETVYRLDFTGRLSFEHSLTTTAPTIVGLTNHAYWNLAAGGTIDGHELVINSDRVLLVDEELIPVGGPAPVAETGFDHRPARPLGEEKLDHCFVLDDAAWAATLMHPESGRLMRILTDQPGLQVYTGDGLPRPRAGICLQTGGWPDAPNRPDFPSCRLDPGETYRHLTTHTFELC